MAQLSAAVEHLRGRMEYRARKRNYRSIGSQTAQLECWKTIGMTLLQLVWKNDIQRYFAQQGKTEYLQVVEETLHSSFGTLVGQYTQRRKM